MPTIVAAYLIIASALWWLVTMGVAVHWNLGTSSRPVHMLVRVGVFTALAAGLVGTFGKLRYIASIWLAVVTTWWFWWGTTLP